MNKFFKPALSLLLDLKLIDYPIDKRLLPLLTFLERHRLALKKYLYPECFNVAMEYLWGYILQVSWSQPLCLLSCDHQTSVTPNFTVSSPGP